LVVRVESPITGVITVWDLGRERRVVFGEDPGAITQSAIFVRGGWAELRREYWGQTLQPPVQLPQRPRVLVLGLGGGTIVRMVYQVTRPSIVTVVELDPVVAEIASEHMGLGSLPDLEIRVGDARDVLTALSEGEPYDIVIEDVFYRGLPDSDATHLSAYVDTLAAVVTDNGWLVLNRWFGDFSGAVVDSGQDALAATLAERFERVQRKQITQRWLNELIFAGRRRTLAQRHDAIHVGSEGSDPHTS
jgi:spermidine synthase